MVTTRELLVASLERARADKMLKNRARDVSAALRSTIPTNFEYFLVLRDDRGEHALMTDSPRDVTIQVLRSAIARIEAGTD